MKISKKLFLLMCFCGLMAGKTSAQIVLSGHGNMALPVLGWQTHYRPAWGFGGRFGYNLTDFFALRVSADYFSFNFKETRLIYKTKAPIQLAGEANIRAGRFNFLGGLGAGVMLQRNIAAGFREKKTSFAAHAILGAEFDLSERFLLHFNSRFFWDNDSPMQTFSLGFGAKL